MEQLETRLDRAQRALTPLELETVIADLPPVPLDAPPQPETSIRRAADADVRERQVVVAIMGGVDRKGHWVPARKTLVFALMGGATLDLREASLPADGIELGILAIWGGVEIIVPPEVQVDMDGIAIMGGFEQKHGGASERQPGAPTVRVTGLALMGGVEVTVRYAGESAREARIRMKDEKKRLRAAERRRER